MNPPATAAVFVVSLLASACATPTLTVPPQLSPGAGEGLSMIVPAKGVQIYECRAAKEGGYQWTFVAPEAQLLDRRGSRVGHHYAGPHWEAVDGSRIVGAVEARADAPAAGAIPWLLLGAKSVGPDGAFSNVTHVQRVNTVGGTAPGSGCSEKAVGTAARVPYTADYYFFSPR
jgi:hypothetical protein